MRTYGTMITPAAKRVLKTWGFDCAGVGCGRRPGAVCVRPRLKAGTSGHARRDLTLLLGRRPTPKERPSFRRFIGVWFRVRLRAVREDDEGNLLDRSCWYSVAGPFLEKLSESESDSVTVSESVSVSLGGGVSAGESASASESEITQTQTSFPPQDAGGDLQRERARPLSVEEAEQLQAVSPEDRETVLLARDLMGGTVVEAHRTPPARALTSELEERLRLLREQAKSIERDAP